jgi:hypothetical protein
MNPSIARDAMGVCGLGCIVAGTWLLAGGAVALLVLGAVLFIAGVGAEMRSS